MLARMTEEKKCIECGRRQQDICNMTINARILRKCQHQHLFKADIALAHSCERCHR